MNKADLVATIHETLQTTLGEDTTKRTAQEVVDAVLNAIADGIKNDAPVQLIGFGTFKISERAAREGRNPQTGETMQIKASKSVRFSPSTNLKASLN